MSGPTQPPTPPPPPPRPARPPHSPIPPLKRRGLAPRWKPLRERNPIPIAVLGLVMLLVFGMVAYRADDLPVLGGGTTYSAYFTEAAGLKSGQEVRVAGVKVGKVTAVKLAGNKVRVVFRVKDAWVGDRTTAAIMIKTLLGSKYLALEPLGANEQLPEQPIGLDRTIAPYDVTTAFDDLGRTFNRLDTNKLAKSMETISVTFSKTPPSVRTALTGLSRLSHTISTRDAQIQQLLGGLKQLSGTIADQNSQFEIIFKDGNLLLAELQRRREAIHAVLVGIRRIARELSALVDELDGPLEPMLRSLDSVTDTLLRNQRNLSRALSILGPYTRLIGNPTGNGRWIDGYLCGTVPNEYLEDGDFTPPARGCEPPRLTGGR